MNHITKILIISLHNILFKLDILNSKFDKLSLKISKNNTIILSLKISKNNIIVLFLKIIVAK